MLKPKRPETVQDQRLSAPYPIQVVARGKPRLRMLLSDMDLATACLCQHAYSRQLSQGPENIMIPRDLQQVRTS